MKNCRHCVLPCNTLDNLKSRVKGKAANADKPRSREIQTLQDSEFLLRSPASLVFCSSPAPHSLCVR